MASFLGACDLGVDGIEFDVHQTSDGHLVVMHDYDLARTTDGSGLVHERELSYVRSLSAGAWRGEKYRQEKIPLLEEVLALGGFDFELEVKGLPTQSLVTGIATAVRAAGVADRVKFTGHHLPALATQRVLIPEARLGLFVPPCQPWMSDHLYQQIVVAFASFGAFDVVQCYTPLLSMLDVDGVRKLGLQVLTPACTTTTSMLRWVATWTRSAQTTRRVCWRCWTPAEPARKGATQLEPDAPAVRRPGGSPAAEPGQQDARRGSLAER